MVDPLNVSRLIVGRSIGQAFNMPVILYKNRMTPKQEKIFKKFVARKGTYNDDLKNIHVKPDGIEATDSFRLLRLNEPQENHTINSAYPDTSRFWREYDNHDEFIEVHVNAEYLADMANAFKTLAKGENITLRINKVVSQYPVGFYSQGETPLRGLIMPVC